MRMVAFDLDGTLTRGQTCMEAIAERFGFADEMAIWEQSRTEADLITARRGIWARLKPLRDADVDAVLAGIPLAPGAAEGIAMLRAAGVHTVIVSLAAAPHAAYFARRLGIDGYIATEPDRHVFPDTKPTLLAEYARTRSLEWLAAVGDTPNDIPLLAAARTSFYVGATLPDTFTPTWHHPAGPIDEIARMIIEETHGTPDPVRPQDFGLSGPDARRIPGGAGGG